MIHQTPHTNLYRDVCCLTTAMPSHMLKKKRKLTGKKIFRAETEVYPVTTRLQVLIYFI